MARQAAERVTDRLVSELGDGLRTVVIVSPSGFDVHHLNEQLRREYSREQFAKVVDTFRLDQPLFSPGIEGEPVGERQAVLHYHENAFVLQLPCSEEDTILISVDPNVGRDLLSFIDSCRDLVLGKRAGPITTQQSDSL